LNKTDMKEMEQVPVYFVQKWKQLLKLVIKVRSLRSPPKKREGRIAKTKTRKKTKITKKISGDGNPITVPATNIRLICYTHFILKPSWMLSLSTRWGLDRTTKSFSLAFLSMRRSQSERLSFPTIHGAALFDVSPPMRPFWALHKTAGKFSRHATCCRRLVGRCSLRWWPAKIKHRIRCCTTSPNIN